MYEVKCYFYLLLYMYIVDWFLKLFLLLFDLGKYKCCIFVKNNYGYNFFIF